MNKANISIQVLFLVLLIFTVNSINLGKKNPKLPQNKSHKCINDENFKNVKRLKAEGYIKHKEVEKLMCTIDRADFSKETPYDWEPDYIGYGATLSAPRVHAFAIEKLYEKFKGKKNLKILDIGSGSGIL